MYKTPKERITGFFNPVKKAVKKVGAAVLSAPARAVYDHRTRKAERDVQTLKRARAYDNAPDHDEKGMPTEAFKARMMADMVRKRRMK